VASFRTRFTRVAGGNGEFHRVLEIAVHDDQETAIPSFQQGDYRTAVAGFEGEDLFGQSAKKRRSFRYLFRLLERFPAIFRTFSLFPDRVGTFRDAVFEFDVCHNRIFFILQQL
jgi:hypothetical protein